MESKQNCCKNGAYKNCCDMSKFNLDMTLRELIEAHGCDPEAVEKKIKNCCGKEDK